MCREILNIIGYKLPVPFLAYRYRVGDQVFESWKALNDWLTEREKGRELAQ